MKVSYLFYLSNADAENIGGICEKDDVPKIVIEGLNKIIMPLFNFDDKKEVGKYLKLVDSKFKNNVDGFIKLRNYPSTKFFVKTTVDCKRNQLSKIEFSDNKGINRKIQVEVDFEKSNYMYGFITTNKYDKFFPNKILKDMRFTLMKIVSQYSDEYIAQKEKTNSKKTTSKNKKTDGNISTTIEKHFNDIVGIFNNYNFLIDY